jgi:hypothetical protein
MYTQYIYIYTYKLSLKKLRSTITRTQRGVRVYQGRAMAQAVSHRPLTAEALVRARANPCGISDRQSGTGTGFLSEFFGFSL